MSNNGVISLSYVINNSQFNSKISDMKKNLALLQIECKNSAKEVDLYGNNMANLAKKQSAIQSAIKQTEKIMQTYNTQLEKNKTSLANNQTELTKLATKKKELTAQYKNVVKVYGEESQEALKLKNSLEQVNKEYEQTKGKVATNKSNIQNYTTQLERTKGTLLDLQNQLQQTNKEIEQQGNKFVKASEKFAAYGSKLESIGGKIQDVGEDAMKAGTLILGAAGTVAKFASDFETSIAKVNSIAKLSKGELKDYADAIMEISNNTGQNAGDVANSVYDAISSGIQVGDATGFVEKMNTLSASGFTSLGNAIDVVTTTINAYGMSVEDATDISDKLITTQNLGKVTVDELSQSMGRIIPTANASNVSLDQLCTGYAVLTSQGIAAAESTTYMNSMFNELSDSGSTVGKILKEKTGKTFKELMESGANLSDVMLILNNSAKEQGLQFSELWGSAEAGKAGLGLIAEEGQKFNKVLGEMQNSTGATKEAFDIVSNTSAYKMQQSLTQLKNSFVKLGESLLPFVDQISEGISKLSEVISGLNPEIIASIAKFGAMAIVFGTLTKATGSLVTIMGKGAKGISAFLKIMADTKATGSFIKALGNSSVAASGLIKTVTSLAGALGSLGPAGAVGLAVVGIAGLVTAWNKFQDGLDESTEGFKTAANNLEDFDGRIRTSESLLTKTFGKKIKIEFSAEFEQAREEVKQGYNDLNEALKNYYEEKWQIDHDGCEDEAEHQKHREENERKHKEELFKIQYGERKDLNEGKDKSMQNVRDYLVNDLQMSGTGAGNTQGEIYSWMNEKIKIVEDGEQKIYEIQKNAYSQNRELTASEQEEINKITEETGKWRALIETGNAQDIFNAWEAEYIKEKTVLEESQKRREKYASDVKDAMWEANKSICSGIDEEIKKIQEADWIKEEDKKREIERLEGQKAAVADFTEQFGNHMETNIKNGESFEVATAKSFEQICNDLENGKINAKEFGMTNEEYMAHAIDAMLEGGASADELTYAIAQIPKDKRSEVLANVKGKEESKELKEAIDKLKDKNIYIRTYYETHGLSNANYHYENGVAVPNRETGGSVNEAGIYNTQEAGLELIDTMSPSQSAYSLAKASRGELTYIPANSKVTNAAMTSLKMESMIDKKLESAMNLYMNSIEKRLINVLKGNNSNGDFIVNMSNPHFENKESEQQNISNIKRIIKSMK